MSYLEFRDVLISFQVFSIRDVEKFFPNFDSRRLVEWQRKGHIRKLVNKWYLFSECPVDEQLLFRISNCIYRPSHIVRVSTGLLSPPTGRSLYAKSRNHEKNNQLYNSNRSI
jgi:hypothetical protein